MRYFIGHLIEGEAGKLQEKLVREAYQKFEIKFLEEHKQPPHLTLKGPFDANEEQLSEMDKLLENFAKKTSRIKYEIDGFGSFRKNVVFMKVIGDDIERIASELVRKLEELKWIDWVNHDKDNEKHFHLTIAKNEEGLKKNFSAVKSWLEQYDKLAKFNLEFNNITVFEKKGKEWIVHKKYLLQ